MANQSRKDLIMTLAKALIAAAWSDGEISLDERNCLKELLFNLREISAHDWATLEIYMAAPIDDEERILILEALRGAIRSPADKRLATDALKMMVESGDQESDSGEHIVSEIIKAIQSTSVDPVSNLSKSLRAPLRQRSESMRAVTSREAELEDFIRNRIAFHFRRKIQDLPIPEISEVEIQIWSSAGGLLARVAHADREVTKGEHTAITLAMAEHWNLPDHVIAALLDIALDEISNGLDLFRLTRQFYLNTELEERKQFVTSLYKIALADGSLSHDETEEIRHIARGLKLTHRQMIDAKLKATGET
jgi:uncharacterized tellurite resistance protein B-like protein